jgi:hypothetical protein
LVFFNYIRIVKLVFRQQLISTDQVGCFFAIKAIAANKLIVET